MVVRRASEQDPPTQAPTRARYTAVAFTLALIGVAYLFGNLGGAASPIVVGIALERWNSWQAPLVSVAVLYVVSALCWLAIDPTQRIEAVEGRR